jgi:diguanylate cyclase (GGDEF)-like protein/PAS domain S-box-containing protein
MLRRARAAGDTMFEYRDRHVCRDGRPIDVFVRFRFAELAGRIYAVASWTDITAKLDDERILRESERRFRTLVENSPDAIVRYDRDLVRVYVNPAFDRLTGSSAASGIGSNVRDDTAILDHARFIASLESVFATGRERTVEYDILTAEGERRWSQIRLAPEIETDETGTTIVSHVMAIIRDVTELVDQREAIRRLAETDTLTSLPNRAQFNAALAGLVAERRRDGGRFSLTIIDLDHFKDVNDGLGHGMGDRLLVLVVERLRSVLPATAALYRLGGDEFALALPAFDRPEAVAALAEAILRHLGPPFLLDDKRIFITASIGTAVFPIDGDTPDAIIASADAAMYDAKRKGRNNHQFYLNELVKQASDRLSVIASLHSAIARQEFELYYQPQVRFVDGTLVGVEALIRWNHPTAGRVPPDRFIPIAEETGLICDIGRWALRQAASDAALWNAGRATPITVAVNLSSRQFLHHDLVATLCEVLAETGCDGRWLELEITEGLMLDDNPAVHRTLAGLRDLGTRIAIDDFGTGHSALGYLDRFPVDALKVDRTFVWRIVEDRRKGELVRAFIAVAQALGIESIAEGVETAEQASLLARFGCRIGQGFLYGRPEPRDAATRRILRDAAPVPNGRALVGF